MEHKMENTLRRYTSSMLPLLARSFFVNVMVDIDGHYYGTINQVFYEKEVLFYGLDDAVLKIDHMLDELRCPRASTELRKFENKSKPDLNTWTVEERIEAEKKKNLHTQYRSIETLKKDAKKQLNCFIVDVMYRQNSSWQGCITWRNYSKKPKREYFRSVLELLKLIQSSFVMDPACKTK